MEWHERGSNELEFTERDFKVCELCGALNPATNNECFVCSWSGRFHTDSDLIRDAMRALESEFGALDESLFAKEVVPSIPPKWSFWKNTWSSIRRLFGRAEGERGREFDY